MNLEQLLAGLTRLKRGSTPYGPAPHKPIFLLTLLDLLDAGIGTDNRFYVNLDLVGVFHQNWIRFAPEGFQEDFTQPFYHLQNDKIQELKLWKVVPNANYVIDGPIKSFKTLTVIANYGTLSPETFLLLANPENRILVRDVLIKTYFASYLKLPPVEEPEDKYLKNLQDYVLNEVPKVMRLQVAEEEMVYVRNWTFKKLVPQVYQNTCAISGMRVSALQGKSLIDACHIVPFSREQDDRVTNGIALCPNLHRAFDGGLVSIDQDYRVIVSAHIVEDRTHPYGLASLEGRKINLPDEQYRWPDQENIQWHRETRFLR
jgi:putative restriction endonuclease